MNKAIMSTLILSLLTSMSMAEGMYWGAGASIEDADVKDNGIAVEFSVGKVFYNNFGMEGKITKTVSASEGKENFIKGELDIMTMSAFATYSHRLTPELMIMPKVGFTHFSTDVDYTNTLLGTSGTSDDSNTNISFGLDMKYKTSMDTNLYIGYTIYKPKFKDKKFDASHLSAGIQKKF